MKFNALVVVAVCCARVVFAESPAQKDDPIIGRWMIEAKDGNIIWTIKGDGTAFRHKPGFKEKGTWKRLNDSVPTKYEFSWGGGRVADTIALSSDHNKIKRKDLTSGAEAQGSRVE